VDDLVGSWWGWHVSDGRMHGVRGAWGALQGARPVVGCATTPIGCVHPTSTCITDACNRYITLTATYGMLQVTRPAAIPRDDSRACPSHGPRRHQACGLPAPGLGGAAQS
jgi:hypothetical protein